VDIDDRVEHIVFAGQEHLRFDFIDECLEVLHDDCQIISDILTFTRQFQQCLNVFDLILDRTVEFDRLFQTRALLLDFAGSFLVGPEGGIADYGLEFVKLMLLAISVKGTSELPRCVFSHGRIVQRVLPASFLRYRFLRVFPHGLTRKTTITSAFK
jgi:hypothetical protein